MPDYRRVVVAIVKRPGPGSSSHQRLECGDGFRFPRATTSRRTPGSFLFRCPEERTRGDEEMGGIEPDSDSDSDTDPDFTSSSPGISIPERRES